MARNQTANSNFTNIFSLNRVKKDCYYQPISVDFNPIQKPNQQFEGIIPFYNNDGRYFTPSFILPKEKSLYETNELDEKNKFHARISHSQNSDEEETPQFKPTDNNYCQLCHEVFSQYWDHINGKYHKRMINSSKSNKQILQLCDLFETLNNVQNQEKTKKINKKKTQRKYSLLSSSSKNAQKKQKTFDKQKTPQKKNNLAQQQILDEKQKQQKKNIQQSLKITLQLGNYSTNMISNPTFKQFCLQT